MSAAEQSDGWIEWAGGECPVADDAVVEVRWLCGPDVATDTDRAGDWSWFLMGPVGHPLPGDIIAYRVIEP